VDELAEVVAGLRTGRPYTGWVRRSGSWGERYSGLKVSGFHLLTRGTGWLITPNDEPRALGPGDVVLAPFGGEHGLSHAPAGLEQLPAAVIGPKADRPGTGDAEFLCGAYWLEHQQVPHHLQALPEVIVTSTADDRNPELRSLVDLIAADTADVGPGTGVTRPALLDLFLTHVMRRWTEQNRTSGTPVMTDPAIAAVLHVIHAEPQEPWTVDRLGRIAGLSRRTFTERFKNATARSPMAYVTAQRLARGARLLRETNAPVAAVAHQTGYSTEFAFSAAFRREYGTPPGRFRRDVDESAPRDRRTAGPHPGGA
jgi:AraC-like DNA-binding protein